MNTYINSIVIILAALVIIVSIILFIKGRNSVTNKKLKYIPLALIVTSFLSIIMLSQYYENQFKESDKQLELLDQEVMSFKEDSIIVANTAEEKNKAIDSLQNLGRELDGIIKNIEQQERVLGKKSFALANAKRMLQRTNEQLKKITTYNEVINSRKFKDIKGYTFSEGAPCFKLIPPSKTDGYSVDFAIRFNDDKVIEDIAAICIDVHKNKDGKTVPMYKKYYIPQPGANAFKLKNAFIDKDVEAYIGFFWKEDMGKTDKPRYEYVKYSLK